VADDEIDQVLQDAERVGLIDRSDHDPGLVMLTAEGGKAAGA
jgi:hypothetical protein